ncbi:MAG: anti-sigma factor [Bacillota bacterium]
MTCLEIQDLLSPYLDEVLGAEELHIVEKHLAVCSDCRDELDSLEQTIRAIRSMGEIEPPPDFSLNLHQRLQSSVIVRKKSFYRSIGHWNWMPLGAVAALLVIMVLSWNVFNNPAPYLPEANDMLASREADSTNPNSGQLTTPKPGSGIAPLAGQETIGLGGAPSTAEQGAGNTGSAGDTAVPKSADTSEGQGKKAATSSPADVFNMLTVNDQNQTPQSDTVAPKKPDQTVSVQNVSGSIAKSSEVTLAVADTDQARQQLQVTAQNYNGSYKDNGETILMSVPQ